MLDDLSRTLPEYELARLRLEAKTRDRSSNECPSREVESTASSAQPGRVTAADLRRIAETCSDLLDPEVMDTAWR